MWNRQRQSCAAGGLEPREPGGCRVQRKCGLSIERKLAHVGVHTVMRKELGGLGAVTPQAATAVGHERNELGEFSIHDEVPLVKSWSNQGDRTGRRTTKAYGEIVPG